MPFTSAAGAAGYMLAKRLNKVQKAFGKKLPYANDVSSVKRQRPARDEAF